MASVFVPRPERSGELVYRARAELDEWQRLRDEDPLDPQRRIIDAHHHLWERGDDVYAIEDFDTEIRASGHRVLASVFVECRWRYRVDGPELLAPVGETSHVVAEAARSDTGIGAAIVGFADLALGDAVRPVLEAHLNAAGARFKGVRQRAVYDPYVRPATPGLRPGLLGEAGFRRGLSVLQSLGLSFDAWQYWHQLDELAALAAALPDVPIIVNHTGGPLGVGPHARDPVGMMRRWREGVRKLAYHENVIMKLGGLGMLHCGFDFHYEPLPPQSELLAAAWRPYIEFCIESFGARRCMFSGNFPVDRQSCGYGSLWNAFKRITASCSSEEKDELFLGTARRAYRLDVPTE
jgi:predicted TIM-barrel fold metal-dependent hydrolase